MDGSPSSRESAGSTAVSSYLRQRAKVTVWVQIETLCVSKVWYMSQVSPQPRTWLPQPQITGALSPDLYISHYGGRLYKYDLDTSVPERTPTISAWKALHNNPETLERKGGETETQRKRERERGGGGGGVKWVEARDAWCGPRSCQHPSRSMSGLAQH